MSPMPITYHNESIDDRAMMAAIRSVLAETPQLDFGPAARAGLEARLDRIPAAEDVTYNEAVVGGVSGWWCHSRTGDIDAAILYLHGGAYVLGSAAGYRKLVSQLVARCGVAAFIADYGLAPERPFPGGLDDAEAVYEALAAKGISRLVLVGDSAGGGLAMALLSRVLTRSRRGLAQNPCAVVLMSPWTDLTLSGGSMETRADRDPALSKRRLATAVKLYLQEREARDAEASPLFADFAGGPPVLIEVGDDEVLLDDSVRLAERLQEQVVQVELHIWHGMIHVFPANVAMLQAAQEALDRMSAFVREKLR